MIQSGRKQKRSLKITPKRLFLGLCLVTLLAALGFVLWAETPLQPAPEALAALQSDAEVKVTTDDFVTFSPVGREPWTAFVFYPGGRVDYRAYAVPLRRIAEHGYLVVLLPVRLNLAFFDVNAAQPAMAAFPSIRKWVVGGHSLGGVAAALYASRRADIDAVVFWASYPADNTLKNKDPQILSVYGTLDMGGSESFTASRANLPADATFVAIEGGNHAQFGDYGFQPGDNEATITRREQQDQVVAATLKFLEEVSR